MHLIVPPHTPARDEPNAPTAQPACVGEVKVVWDGEPFWFMDLVDKEVLKNLRLILVSIIASMLFMWAHTGSFLLGLFVCRSGARTLDWQITT